MIVLFGRQLPVPLRADRGSAALVNRADEVPSSLDDVHLQHIAPRETCNNHSCPSRHCLINSPQRVPAAWTQTRLSGGPDSLGRVPIPPGYQTASLSSLAARKATFLLALILIGSPVAGLRPMRAARLRTWRMPRPLMRMRSPFLRCLTRSPTKSLRIVSACFFGTSWVSARAAARCLMVTVVGVAAFAMS